MMIVFMGKKECYRKVVSDKDDFSADELSKEETELIVDLLEWAGEVDRQILERQTAEDDSEDVGFREAVEFLIPENAAKSEAQMFRFFRLEREIQSGPVVEYEQEGLWFETVHRS